MISVPFREIVKLDKQKNRVQIKNSSFEASDKKSQGNLGKFLEQIGFTKKTESLYVFEIAAAKQPEEQENEDEEKQNKYIGNTCVIEHALSVITEI